MNFTSIFVNICKTIALIVMAISIATAFLGLIYNLLNPDTKGMSLVDLKFLAIVFSISASLFITSQIASKLIRSKIKK